MRGDSSDDADGVAAGWPFFGQLIAHDITADRSPLVHRADGERTENFRSPRANLECIYFKTMSLAANEKSSPP
jgi:hypothetical protein